MTSDGTESPHRAEKPPKRPLIIGAMAGALIGAGFGALITLLNLGGKGDWTLAVPGSVFNGALVGVIVGAIIREMWAKDQPAAKRGRVRTIVLGAGVAVILALVGLIFLMRS